MRGLPRIGAAETHRVRRWDVVILGGALPGLIAAVRLGQRGARVMVVEEPAARRCPGCVREPFLVTGAGPSGVLGECLRDLGVPLIDQRRFAVDDVALQVVTPEARVDLGRSARTAAELVGWGLAKPDDARVMLRALEQAATAEREALLAAPPHRSARPRLRRDAAVAPAPTFARGWPREAAEAPEALRRIFDAVTRALSNLGAAPPPPEARARLVGGLLTGACVLGGEEGGLRPMIRRRAAALFAEFRNLEGRFELVSVAGQPAIAPAQPKEIWAGRLLVLNAPVAAVAAAIGDAAPSLLRGTPPTRRRFQRCYSVPRSILPEGMSDRVVCLPGAASGESAAPPVVALRRVPGSGSGEDRLVASAVGPLDAPRPEMDAWIDRNVRRLLPFSEGALQPHPLPQPLWDTDTLLCDPKVGDGASPAPTQLSGRPPIHVLDRASVGGLGFEGDLLLGWRAGDAIADELP